MKNALHWAITAVALLGRDRTADLLQRALGGERDSRKTICEIVEAAIALKPREEQEDWRCQLPVLGHDLKYRVFLQEAREVYEVLQSGALEAAMQEQREREERESRANPTDLVPPSPNEGEEFDDYMCRLDAWASDKSEKLLREIDFDSYSLAVKFLGKPSFDPGAFVTALC